MVINVHKTDWELVKTVDIRGLRLINHLDSNWWSLDDQKLGKMANLAEKARLSDFELEKALGFMNFISLASWYAGGAVAALISSRRERRTRLFPRHDYTPFVKQVSKSIQDGVIRRIFSWKNVVVLASDASSKGLGGIILEGIGKGKRWSMEAHDDDIIALRELKAIKESILRLGIWNVNLLILCDNKAIEGAIKKGFSPAVSLRRELENLFSLVTTRGIGIRIEWIPTEENQAADELSRLGRASEEGICRSQAFAEGLLARKEVSFNNSCSIDLNKLK